MYGNLEWFSYKLNIKTLNKEANYLFKHKIMPSSVILVLVICTRIFFFYRAHPLWKFHGRYHNVPVWQPTELYINLLHRCSYLDIIYPSKSKALGHMIQFVFFHIYSLLFQTTIMWERWYAEIHLIIFQFLM